MPHRADGGGHAAPQLRELSERHAGSAAAPSDSILIKGGSVLSMDRAVGDHAVGDVLIVGDRIVEVGGSIDATGAAVIDARDRIVMPRFCDPHIHCWEGALGQLHTMRLFTAGFDDNTELFKLRKELDVWISFDSGIERQPVAPFYEEGWLDGREAINHANFLSSDQHRVVVDGRSQVNVWPRIESQFRYGEIPYTEWVDSGLRPGLSNDNPMTFGIDVFSEMRALYLLQRVDEHRGGLRAASLREVLQSATQQGADNCGLSGVTGSLTPGKKADVVLLDVRQLPLFPRNNVLSSVVQAANTGCVDTVIVDGRVRKWAGDHLGVDFARVRRLVAESHEYLLRTVDWPHDAIDFDD